jgi:uncharacterized phiE125 gp8 family phage protein
MMTPILLTPPAQEPVTLAEAKLHLKVEGATEDDLILSLVSAARLIVEAASGRMLIDQTWRLVMDAWPGDGRLRLPVGPLRGVSGARVFDAQGVAAPLAPSLFSPEPGSDPPVLALVAALPPPGRPRQGVEVDVIAGFGDEPSSVPAPLRQAILRLVARWFENRGDALAAEAAALPADVAALIAPYRRARL